MAAAGLAALVPLILFAGFWIRAELGKSQRDVDLFLGARALALSQRIDAELEQQLSAMRALSALPNLDTDAASFQDAAKRIAGTMSYWTSLSLVDAGSGRTLFSTKPDSPDAPGAAFVRRASTERQPVIESRPSATGRGSGIVLYMPVVRDSAVGSVLVMTFDANDIQSIVARQTRDADLLAVVVDADNRIIARSLSPQTTIGSDASDEFRSATRDRDSGVLRTTLREGEPVDSGFVKSPLTGWTAVASISQRQSAHLTSQSVWATVIAGALSLMLAGILAVFIIHTVMERRVSEERLAASRALGDLDARLLATTQEALSEQRKAGLEREVLLREIYHRVKNNLQIVQSLLRLGARDLRPEQREPFENAVRRIGAMARVHTLLYNSPDLASIDFRDYLEELIRELSEGFSAHERSIESILRANPMRMPLDTAVPLAFIAVEILTNSFKHAFPQGRSGQITVDVARDDGHAVLEIRDNGVGMSESVGRRKLGLTIVRKLVQQIGGELEEPKPGASTFTVRFPLDEIGAGEGVSSRVPQPA